MKETPSAAGRADSEPLDAAAVCRREVIVVQGDIDAASASRLLRHRRARCVVVRDPGAPTSHGIVGLLTDQDIAAAATARAAEPRSLRVRDVMRPPAVIVTAGEPLDSLPALMRAAGASRAPVVGADSRLVGVLWIEDVLERVLDQMRRAAQSGVRRPAI